MKFEDFKNIKEFEDFKKLKTLNLKNYNEFKEFYDRTTGGDNHWHYSANLVVSDLITQNKYKFVVIDMEDGDRVFVELKLIQLHKTRQLRIMNAPISLNNNYDNVIKVIDALKDLSYIKGTIKEKDLVLFKNWIVEKDKEETEHYSDLEQWKLKCNNNKWITKRRIKWTLNDENFVFSEATSKDIKDMTEFFDSWVEYKENRNKDVSAKRMYYKVIEATGKRKDIKMYIMRYKGKIVSMLGYTLHKNTANQIINMSAPRTTIQYDDEKARKIFFDLTHQMTWFTYLELDKEGIDCIYCGDGTDSKGMEIYKSQCNTNLLKYSKVAPMR